MELEFVDSWVSSSSKVRLSTELKKRDVLSVFLFHPIWSYVSDMLSSLYILDHFHGLALCD